MSVKERKPKSRSNERVRGSGKRELAVRAMVAETSWLDGWLEWQDGHVVWVNEHGSFTPADVDLALAQRHMNQIARYRPSAERALGDLNSWLKHRSIRLEIAKKLSGIAAPDLPDMARNPDALDAAAIRRLATLLTAEIFCVNPLPVSPSQLLSICGERAKGALLATLADTTVPRGGRALAALTLGATHRRSGHPPHLTRPSTSSNAPTLSTLLNEPWLRNSYKWGSNSGMPDDPDVIVKLLRDEDGMRVARRYVRAAAASGQFALPVEMVREALSAGVPMKRIAELAEALVQFTPLAERILSYRNELPAILLGGKPDRVRRAALERHEAAQRISQERRQTVDELARLVHEYVLASGGDPSAVRSAANLVQAILDICPRPAELGENALRVLEIGLSLPPNIQVTFLNFVIENRDRIWNPKMMPRGNDFRNWLKNRCGGDVQPLATLMCNTAGDVALVREALELGYHRSLSHAEWSDADSYRWVLDVARDLDLSEADSLDLWALEKALRILGSPRAARAAFQPLMAALKRTDVPLPLRAHLIGAMLDQTTNEREDGLRERISLFVRYLPDLKQFEHLDHFASCPCWYATKCLPILEKDLPDHARDIFWWLYTSLWEAYKQYPNADPYPWVKLASAIHQINPERCRDIVRAGIRKPLSYRPDRLYAGIDLLSQFPALHVPFADMFVRRPQRTVQIIEWISVLPRLGKEALAPLQQLEEASSMPSGDEESLPPDWRSLLDNAPDLVAPALSYIRAQRLLGGSLAIPPGVARAAVQPRRWAEELAYLEGILRTHPERTALAARARNLRARLSDPEGVADSVREELGDTLREVTAEASLAAIEHLIRVCCLSRLESFTGPLPTGIPFDQDLLNATLLANDIRSNRRLLVRLLRAHIAGKRNWREEHPSNVAFLKVQQSRGVDIDYWLGSHPQTIRCPGVSGGTVRIYLERDPLRILQMGNYFDTCLSLDGFNAFSTVANACELNKRVIYAEDRAGRVIGRKLIGINAEGSLVGFRTYIALDWEAGGKELHAAFRQYAEAFSRSCGLALANAGTVPRLFAQEWYDDGVVPWDEQAVPPTSRSKHPDAAATP